MKNHVLHRLKFEINAPSEMNGKQLQQDISKLVKGRILKIIDSIFDTMGNKKNIRIPKLELEINAVPSDNWEATLEKKLRQQLSSYLNNWEDTPIDNPNNPYLSGIPEEDSLFYFLENGTLPWHSNSLTINELKEYFQTNIEVKNFQTNFVELLQTNENALKRFLLQFEKQELISLLNVISNHSDDLILFFEKLENIYKKWWNPLEVKTKIWFIFFKNLKKPLDKKLNFEQVKNEILEQSFSFFSKTKKIQSKKEAFVKALLEELKKTFPNSDFCKKSKINSLNFKEQNLQFEKNEASKIENHKATENQDHQENQQNENQQKHQNEILSKELETISVNISNQEGFYIDNAGLVILHPFFQYLFKDVGFTNNHQFVDSHLQQQAALALHFIVTGNEMAFEPDLIFNKILCNIPITKPIENQFFLNEKLKLECEALLNATIHHWAALKNTSIEGLRNTFLQREGKISQKENGDWLLQVQSTSVDVLLSKMPWGLGIVKLPWMESNLFVEWA